ncbi:MAG: hypothetical protein Q9220_006278 [cf. Caloplaca sp. 1 TL-2023]
MSGLSSFPGGNYGSYFIREGEKHVAAETLVDTLYKDEERVAWTKWDDLYYLRYIRTRQFLEMLTKTTENDVQPRKDLYKNVKEFLDDHRQHQLNAESSGIHSKSQNAFIGAGQFIAFNWFFLEFMPTWQQKRNDERVAEAEAAARRAANMGPPPKRNRHA